MKKVFSTKVIAYSAILVVLSIVLTRFLGFMIYIFGNPTFSIEFGATPIVAGGMAFGPIVGGVIGLVSDLVGFIINQRGGAYNPGFTLNSILTGVIPGLVIYVIKKSKLANYNLMWIVFSLLLGLGVVGDVYLSTIDKIVTGKTTLIFDLPLRASMLVIFNLAIIIAIGSLIYLKNKYRNEKTSLYSLDKIIIAVVLVEVLVYITLTPIWLTLQYNYQIHQYLTSLFLRVIRASVLITVKSLVIYLLLKVMSVRYKGLNRN